MGVRESYLYLKERSVAGGRLPPGLKPEPISIGLQHDGSRALSKHRVIRWFGNPGLQD
jgi:hypothetical protein